MLIKEKTNTDEPKLLTLIVLANNPNKYCITIKDTIKQESSNKTINAFDFFFPNRIKWN